VCGRGERGGAHGRRVRFKGMGDGRCAGARATSGCACIVWLALGFLIRARLARCKGEGPDKRSPPIGWRAESRPWVAIGGGSSRA
jgi:hypothetical protein